MIKNRRNKTWRSFHRWAGIILAIFLLLFSISGLILNHRELFSSCSVSRSLLPSSYRIKNFNNGVVKGTLSFSADSVLVYGNSGIWMADRNMHGLKDFNEGLPDGPDRRNIRNIERTKDGTLWCAAQFGLYKYAGSGWQEVSIPGNNERIADVALNADSSSIVLLTRSALYVPSGNGFERIGIEAPSGYSDKVSLFKTVWHLHSGDLFGTPGRLVVDTIAVIIIFLSVTGIILFIMPYSIKRSAHDRLKNKVRFFRWNFRWHDKIGYVTIIFTIMIAVTGMCLRPPLMIPLVMIRTSPLPGSAFDSENVWQDKLRAIRYDHDSDKWLLSTSEGFMLLDRDFSGKPQPVAPEKIPPVSPMGVNVFEYAGSGKWLVGSFSGLYLWDPKTGVVTDYMTGEIFRSSGRAGRPVAVNLVSGYSRDLDMQDAVFDYSSGINHKADMPDILAKQPISLWNFALELHVGRCYVPFLGPFSELFVFLSGLLLTLILVSGLIIHNRTKNINK